VSENSRLNASTQRVAASQQQADLGIAFRSEVSRRFLDLVQPVMQRFDQHRPPFRVVEQILLQVRIALHCPDVRRAPRTSMRALRPVRRSLRSSSSTRQASGPSSRMTISRSENEV